MNFSKETYRKIFCAKKCLVLEGERYCDFILNIEKEVFDASSIPKDPMRYMNPHKPYAKSVPLNSTYPEMARLDLLAKIQQKYR